MPAQDRRGPACGLPAHAHEEPEPDHHHQHEPDRGERREHGQARLERLAPPDPVREPVSVPAEPVRDDAISSASLDDLNKSSPLKPVYFELDSSDLNASNQKTLDENAALISTLREGRDEARAISLA